jgi:hypothetical protein
VRPNKPVHPTGHRQLVGRPVICAWRARQAADQPSDGIDPVLIPLLNAGCTRDLQHLSLVAGGCSDPLSAESLLPTADSGCGWRTWLGVGNSAMHGLPWLPTVTLLMATMLVAPEASCDMPFWGPEKCSTEIQEAGGETCVQCTDVYDDPALPSEKMPASLRTAGWHLRCTLRSNHGYWDVWCSGPERPERLIRASSCRCGISAEAPGASAIGAIVLLALTTLLRRRPRWRRSRPSRPTGRCLPGGDGSSRRAHPFARAARPAPGCARLPSPP